MEGSYPVIFENKHAGTVTVKKQGLYYDFECKCTLKNRQLYRLTLTLGDIRTDLGICVPQNGCFGLRTRLPAKKFGTGEPLFYINAKKEQKPVQYIPLSTDQPFPELDKLRMMCLVNEEGKQYLTDRSQDPQDSDQNP